MKVVGLLILILLPAASLGGQDQSRIDAVFAPLVESRSPGVAVLARKNGQIVFQRGYGVRDLRTFTKIDRRTDFRLASCTKQFTAMATMLLVHDGKLRYDTRLTDIFSDFPEFGRRITVRHLLTHTSGLPDYEDLMTDTWTPSHQIQDEEVLSLLKRATPKFVPGTNWAYSNSGYVLLGLIVGRVSGVPFPQFLHDRIFQPLDMTGSSESVRSGFTRIQIVVTRSLRPVRLGPIRQSCRL
jgi:CubicO group peptidase (beta-lactamase class C family)